jgi:predicted site-specific integrase-resolvase
MSYYKKGLKKLLDGIIAGQVGRLVITRKDRLLRFGSELVFSICAAKGVEVVTLNQGEDGGSRKILPQDVLEIITVFSAWLYGSRSQKNPKLLVCARPWRTPDVCGWQLTPLRLMWNFLTA